MARNTGGSFWFDGIGPTIGVMQATLPARVEGSMREAAGRVEGYAKMNAPWSDRTGMARAGLRAEVHEEAGEIVLELYHTAEHGYWLEVARDGQFAIIMPTLEVMGPEIIAEAGGVVTSIDRSF